MPLSKVKQAEYERERRQRLKVSVIPEPVPVIPKPVSVIPNVTPDQPKAELVQPKSVIPCVKGPGSCDLRTDATKSFSCIYTPPDCPFWRHP